MATETSAWFDYKLYMANKLTQLTKTEPDAGWDMPKLVKALAAAGYVDEIGAEKHFTDYGQYENLAPNAFFNATEYLRAKAAQVYTKPAKDVDAVDVANVQAAIENAGMSPWSHYELFGNEEGINPSNSFNTAAYMNAKLAALNSVVDGKQWTLPELYDAFKAAGLSALEHFLTYAGNSGSGEVAQGLVNGKIPPAFAVLAKDKVNPDVTVGITTPLQTGFDDAKGTVDNDTFVAAKDTLDAVDKIDGGAGTDTLKIFASGGSAHFADADIKNVEIVRMLGSISTDVINVSGNADVEELWFDGGTMGTATLTVNQKLGFTGTVTAATIVFEGAATGTADSATLAFENATMSGGMTVANIENLTFELSAANTLNTVTAASATTLTIVGDGETTVTLANQTTFKSVDTTGFTGDLDLTLAAVTAEFTYTGGAGNDDLTLAAHDDAKYNINLGAGADFLTLGATTFATTAKIDGGEGYDTLSIAAAITDFKPFSNFDALEITAATAQDVSLFTGTDIVMNAAGTFTITNLRADQDLILDSTGATVVLTYTAAGATPEHTVNLLLADMNDATPLTGVTLSELTDATASVKTLNITSEGGSNVIASLAGAKGLKTVNIDGSSDLNVTTGAVAGFTVNAEKFTGDLTFDGIASTGPLTVTGGKGNDTITGGALADKLFGGDGDDKLVAGTGTASATGDGWDVLEGGKGSDDFDVAGITAANATFSDYKAAMVTIKDFEKGESIKVTANDVTTITKYAGTGATLEAIVMEVVKETSDSLKWFTLDGHTYIVNNNAGDSSTPANADDQVIKLVGEFDLSDATVASSVITW